MNRVLKFRVWNTYQKKFLESDQVGISGIGTILIYDWHNDTGKSWAHDCWNGNNLYVIQQFTGLQDKNGVDIYEGDILKLFNDKDELYEVVYNYFDHDIVGFILEGNGGRGDWFSPKDREVVGNIFENPNLLT